MASSNLILSLAKVVIAAAWADGEVAHDELNSLKDLLFHIPDITGREWAMLEMYLEAPVGPAERDRLVQQLLSELKSGSDKALALKALGAMVKSDGEVTPEEKRVWSEMEAAIQNADVGLAGAIGRLLPGPLSRRAQATTQAPNREQFFEDFIKNKVFYEVRRRLSLGEGADIKVPEPELRKLSLAGGLMARVAHVDREIDQAEFDQMVSALQSGWGIGKETATFVAEVALSEVSGDLDYYRLSRGFFEKTSESERENFMAILFRVASADGFATHEEIEELRAIATSLKLTHKQFIDAKLTVPRDQRAN